MKPWRLYYTVAKPVEPENPVLSMFFVVIDYKEKNDPQSDSQTFSQRVHAI